MGTGRYRTPTPAHAPVSDSPAVNVILVGHLWEALEFLKISFDGGKNGGLERGKGRKIKQTHHGTKAK